MCRTAVRARRIGGFHVRNGILHVRIGSSRVRMGSLRVRLGNPMDVRVLSGRLCRCSDHILRCSRSRSSSAHPDRHRLRRYNYRMTDLRNAERRARRGEVDRLSLAHRAAAWGRGALFLQPQRPVRFIRSTMAEYYPPRSRWSALRTGTVRVARRLTRCVALSATGPASPAPSAQATIMRRQAP